MNRYAISHAPKGVRGGPWEARQLPLGRSCRRLSEAEISNRPCGHSLLAQIRNIHPTAHVVRLVRKTRYSDRIAIAYSDGVGACAAERDRLLCERNESDAQIERMRPVVEAALVLVAAHDVRPTKYFDWLDLAALLIEAVHDYRKKALKEGKAKP